jgi:hypothetical protein
MSDFPMCSECSHPVTKQVRVGNRRDSKSKVEWVDVYLEPCRHRAGVRWLSWTS